MAGERQALIAMLESRIRGLVNRGGHICTEAIPHPGADGYTHSCARCGYSPDVHLLRDALAALAPEPTPLTAADACARCGHDRRWHAGTNNGLFCQQCACGEFLGGALDPPRVVQPSVPACRTHGDPLVCLVCEAEEDAKPEWKAFDPAAAPFCRKHRTYKKAVAHYFCEACHQAGEAMVGPASAHEPTPDPPPAETGQRVITLEMVMELAAAGRLDEARALFNAGVTHKFKPAALAPSAAERTEGRD